MPSTNKAKAVSIVVKRRHHIISGVLWIVGIQYSIFSHYTSSIFKLILTRGAKSKRYDFEPRIRNMLVGKLFSALFRKN